MLADCGGTIFKLAVAETLRKDREKELADSKIKWVEEAKQFILELDRVSIVNGLKDKNPSLYVKSLMQFDLEDINAVLASRSIARSCACCLQDLDVALRELEKRDLHAQVVADATFYLSAKGAGGKTVQDFLSTKEQAAKVRKELNQFAQHVRLERKIAKYTWGCTWIEGKHITGMGALHRLTMEREELLTKIPYIYSKMMDMMAEKIKLE
jgi:hypothetical protein